MDSLKFDDTSSEFEPEREVATFSHFSDDLSLTI